MADDLMGLGKAIEAITKELGELVNPLLRPGAEVAGQMLADQWNHWRLTRMVSLVKKQKQLLEENNIQPKAVPPKLLVPILSSGSLEEDDYLINKWAGLLASAAAGDPIHTSYPKILSELTSGEAKILDILYERATDNILRPETILTTKELFEKMHVDSDDFEAAIYNLKRVGLCDLPAVPLGAPVINFDFFQDIPPHFKISISPLGYRFVRACQGPSSNNKVT